MKTWLQGVKDAEAFVRDYTTLPILARVPTSNYDRGLRDYLRHLYFNRSTIRIFYCLSEADQAVVANLCAPEHFQPHPTIAAIQEELR